MHVCVSTCVCLCVTIPRNIGMFPLILAILYKVLNYERYYLLNSWDSSQHRRAMTLVCNQSR